MIIIILIQQKERDDFIGFGCIGDGLSIIMCDIILHRFQFKLPVTKIPVGPFVDEPGFRWEMVSVNFTVFRDGGFPGIADVGFSVGFKPVVADEIQDLSLLREGNLSTDADRSIPECRFYGEIIDAFPPDTGIGQGSGSHEKDIVQYRDGLSLVHLGPFRIHHSEQSQYLDPEDGFAIPVEVQSEGRDAFFLCNDVKQAGVVIEEIVLNRFQRHIGFSGGKPDPSREGGPEVHDFFLSDKPRLPDIPLYNGRKVLKVGFLQDTRLDGFRSADGKANGFFELGFHGINAG